MLSLSKISNGLQSLGSQSYGKCDHSWGARYSLARTNESPAVEKSKGTRETGSILMCFDEKDWRRFLWQLVVPKLAFGKR